MPSPYEIILNILQQNVAEINYTTLAKLVQLNHVES